MNKNNRIILASLGMNFFLALFIQIITGSTTGWMVFIIIVATFLPIMIGNAKRAREDQTQENGQ